MTIKELKELLGRIPEEVEHKHISELSVVAMEFAEMAEATINETDGLLSPDEEDHGDDESYCHF